MRFIRTGNLALFTRGIGIVAFLFLAAGTAGIAFGSEYITPPKLTRILESGNMDAIHQALNDVKRQRRKDEIIPFIVDLWRMDHEKRPDLPWDTIKETPVRLELAHILVQSVHNGYVDMDLAPMHALARSEAVNGTPRDIVTAMMVLLTINDPEDIPLLKEIALEEHPITFRMSVIAIVEMCDDEPREVALTEIAASIRDSENLQFLKDYRDDATRIRRARCFRQ